MCRSVALVALLMTVLGCTRYGTNPVGGPFTRRVDPDVNYAPPSVNNSPLALGGPAAPGSVAAVDTSIVPPRPPEDVRLAGGNNVPMATLPMRGIEDVVPRDAAVPARRGEPQPELLPSPYAPRTASGVLTAGGVGGAAIPDGLSPAAMNLAEMKKVVAFASDKWAKVDTYEAVVTRREVTANKEKSEDVVLYQFRKEPMGVYIKNIGASGKGREIVYTKKTDKLYVVLGEGDNVILPAGFKSPPMSPDDPRVKEKSRYSIREAGYGTPIAKLGSWVAKAEAGRIAPDALTLLGPVPRKEYPYPLIGISLKLRPGDDPLMPNGGNRYWLFDPKTDSPSYGWPVVIFATEHSGKELEYYLFEKVRLQVPLTDADFAPERLGKK